MKAFCSSILMAAALLLTASCSNNSTVTIGVDVLGDKIKGGWAGQTIGCTYGGPTEFRWRGEMIPDSVPLKWDDGAVEWWFDNSPGLYDDVYMDLTFVDVIDRLGIDAPADSFAVAFANAPYPLWHANQAARYNILRGIMPPESGHWANNPHADDIDYQIEADYAGLMCPAMPNSASEISDRVGHIMNYGNGWYGGVFVGAMYSLAFVYTDVARIVDEALLTIPQQSDFYRCIADVIEWHRQRPDDWRYAWTECQKRWADEVGCPEGVNDPLNIDAMINAAYIVIGLLYGEADFGKTMEIATRCGQDSDCNPASAAGILGTMLGYSNIPEQWMANLHQVENRKFIYTNMSLNDVYDKSFAHALAVIEQGGGKVDDNSVTIKVQKPEPVRYEKSFDGLEVSAVLPGGDVAEMNPVNFGGCAVVAKGEVRSADESYVAHIEAIVDGEVADTIDAPARFYSRTQDLYWNYQLPQDVHTLQLRVLNPEEGAQVVCHRIVVYSSTAKE